MLHGAGPRLLLEEAKEEAGYKGCGAKADQGDGGLAEGDPHRSFRVFLADFC